MSSVKKSIPLVVTTIHKGVFFGYGQKTNEKTITIEKAQMCIKWESSIRGIFGLAATGPDCNCKISPSVPSVVIQDVTSVIECTLEAAEAWSKKPWA
jgi:hypothetical protein